MIRLQGRLCGVPFFELALWHQKGKWEWPTKLAQRILGQLVPYLVVSLECWLGGTPRLYAILLANTTFFRLS